jgi:pimeloyl-ACP methyl ester carboxylesterase
MTRVEFDQFPGNAKIAFMTEGPPDDRLSTGFFWLGGFMSDMTGSKAESLAELARATRRSFLRFDYWGHGQSEGEFTDGTISIWLEQATHMFIKHTRGRRIVVGSSMGGWLALLLMQKLRLEDPPSFRRIAGLVLMAPAADMTRDLMWDEFSPEQRADIADDGLTYLASGYGPPYPITRGLIEDGKRHLILTRGIATEVPVRILQGTRDTDVPPEHAIRTFDAISGDDVTLQMIKHGDHRLSAPPYLRLLNDTVLSLAQRSDGETF